MATTKLANLIVPEVFARYMVEQTSEKSAFFRSGIVETVPNLNLLGDGGQQVQLPFWQDLSGDDQLLDDSTNLTVTAVTGQKDVGVLHARALVYGSTDIAAALAGDDPVARLADMYVSKWDRQWQKLMISSLNGALGSATMTSNVLDISALTGAASDFDGESFIDATAKLGDQSDRLAGLAVHSATYHSMLKQDLIDFIPDSEGKPTIATYQGKQVIVDDGLPVDGSTYTTYIFGMGAIGYGEAMPKVPFEVEREALLNGGEEYAVSRRHFVLHPRGIAWTPASGVPAKNTPSNTELGGTGNWTRRYEPQNIRIVQFKHSVAA